MLKRIFLGLAIAAGLLSPAYSAGTLPGFSVSQQMDKFGKPLAGCTLYIIQAGTVSTPQIAYQDSGLTIPVPGGSQLTCDAAGRLPQFFLADGSIKIRLTDVNGVQQFTADGLLVVGPSGGGGGGSTVDPTTILSTGDFKASYGTGGLAGFVRCNGKTIGSATSGATERANADTSALFAFLWNGDTNLAVSGGRGLSAVADFAANKALTLPDCRNKALASLGDMGNSDAALYAGSTFSYGNSTTLGAKLGVGTPRTLAQSALPNFTPTIDASTAVWNTVAGTSGGGNFGGGAVSYINGLFNGGTTGAGVTNYASKAGLAGGSITANSINGGVAQTSFDTVSPFILVTTYIKL